MKKYYIVYSKIYLKNIINAVIKIYHNYRETIRKTILILFILLIMFIFVYLFKGLIFLGSNVRNIISLLIQCQATVLAIVVSLTLVGVQLVAQKYTLLIVKVFINDKYFRGIFSIYLIAIFIGLFLLYILPTNLDIYLNRSIFVNNDTNISLIDNSLTRTYNPIYIYSVFIIFLLYMSISAEAFLYLKSYMEHILEFLKPENIVMETSSLYIKHINDAINRFDTTRDHKSVENISSEIESSLTPIHELCLQIIKNDYVDASKECAKIYQKLSEDIVKKLFPLYTKEYNLYKEVLYQRVLGIYINHLSNLMLNSIKLSSYSSVVQFLQALEEIARKLGEIIKMISLKPYIVPIENIRIMIVPLVLDIVVKLKILNKELINSVMKKKNNYSIVSSKIDLIARIIPRVIINIYKLIIDKPDHTEDFINYLRSFLVDIQKYIITLDDNMNIVKSQSNKAVREIIETELNALSNELYLLVLSKIKEKISIDGSERKLIRISNHDCNFLFSFLKNIAKIFKKIYRYSTQYLESPILLISLWPELLDISIKIYIASYICNPENEEYKEVASTYLELYSQCIKEIKSLYKFKKSSPEAVLYIFVPMYEIYKVVLDTLDLIDIIISEFIQNKEKYDCKVLIDYMVQIVELVNVSLSLFKKLKEDEYSFFIKEYEKRMNFLQEYCKLS